MAATWGLAGWDSISVSEGSESKSRRSVEESIWPPDSLSERKFRESVYDRVNFLC